jgi:enterochelin esterase-like enzyme
MPIHNFQPCRGSFVELVIDSEVLRSNMLGDPHVRSVKIYLPEGYANSDSDYPLFVALAGFTGSGLKLLSWQSFGESVPQRVDRLIAEGRMGPAIFAFPDCFTSLGGNQYIDSISVGAWERFLIDEMLPRIEDGFRVRRGREHRAVFGKSSGGYGSMIHGMKHADTWGAIASHSGDAGFEHLFLPEFPKALDALAPHEGDVAAFLAGLRDSKKIGGGEFHALMTLAMAATYAPEADAPLGIRLPVDPHTCELDESRWQRWLEHDPVRLVERDDVLENLRSLRCLFFDCGSRDQYFIHYGNRALSRRLQAAEIDHIYEEFPDNHSGVDYRLDRSLPLLHDAVGRGG